MLHTVKCDEPIYDQLNTDLFVVSLDNQERIYALKYDDSLLSSVLIGVDEDKEKYFINNIFGGHFTPNQKSTYINQSSYKLRFKHKFFLHNKKILKGNDTPHFDLIKYLNDEGSKNFRNKLLEFG